jgi:hypothetical protein
LIDRLWLLGNQLLFSLTLINDDVRQVIMRLSSFLVPIFSFFVTDLVRADVGLVLTWQNKAGYWFACGPVQCLQMGEASEEKALDYVLVEGRHSYTYQDKYGRCNRYSVSGVNATDFSWAKVERLAKCN